MLIIKGNTGLGLEAIKALYGSSNSYEIVIGCRTVSKGEAAADSVKKEITKSSSNISVVQIDLASDKSIEAALKQIESKHSRLDVLLNNGGANFDVDIQSGKLSVREGFNASWDTNVAGTQVLTTGAIPLLLKSSDPRLMFVTSGTSTMAETERYDNEVFRRINGFPEAGWPKQTTNNPITAYRSSKAGLNMLMREWHRILGNDGVKVWCISPGFLATGLAGIGTEQLKKVKALALSPELILIVADGCTGSFRWWSLHQRCHRRPARWRRWQGHTKGHDSALVRITVEVMKSAKRA